MSRIESLDWLRAFMAITIMVYHYIGWMFGSTEPGSLLWVLGIYGVSIFFILSGLSLSIGYNSKINSSVEIADFVVKRLFRILPVMWIATTLALISHGSGYYPASTILMNYTATFGFFEPTAYMMTGGWSIGNEIVFYALFPIIVIAYRRSKQIGNLVVCFTIVLGIYHTFTVLPDYSTLGAGWGAYVNPMNQLFLFAMGIYIFYNFKDVVVSNKMVAILIGVSVFIFMFPHNSIDQIEIVTGFNRVVLSIASTMVVFAFYKMRINNINRYLESFLNFLGQASYSIYILHPIVYRVTFEFLDSRGISDKTALFILSFAFTIVISGIVYKYIEKPFIKLGRYVSEKLIIKSK